MFHLIFKNNLNSFSTLSSPSKTKQTHNKHQWEREKKSDFWGLVNANYVNVVQGLKRIKIFIPVLLAVVRGVHCSVLFNLSLKMHIKHGHYFYFLMLTFVGLMLPSILWCVLRGSACSCGMTGCNKCSTCFTIYFTLLITMCTVGRHRS